MWGELSIRDGSICLLGDATGQTKWEPCIGGSRNFQKGGRTIAFFFFFFFFLYKIKIWPNRGRAFAWTTGS